MKNFIDKFTHGPGPGPDTTGDGTNKDKDKDKDKKEIKGVDVKEPSTDSLIKYSPNSSYPNVGDVFLMREKEEEERGGKFLKFILQTEEDLPNGGSKYDSQVRQALLEIVGEVFEDTANKDIGETRVVALGDLLGRVQAKLRSDLLELLKQKLKIKEEERDLKLNELNNIQYDIKLYVSIQIQNAGYAEYYTDMGQSPPIYLEVEVLEELEGGSDQTLADASIGINDEGDISRSRQKEQLVKFLGLPPLLEIGRLTFVVFPIPSVRIDPNKPQVAKARPRRPY